MKNFKNTAKRGLALLLALVMTAGLMSLTAFAEEEPQPETPPAASENTPKPLPDLSPADPNAVPTEAPYLPPYEDAKEADKLDGEKLTGVNGQIDGAVTDANEAIDSANDAADEAAADANGKLDVIEKAVEEQSGAAEEAAAAANAAADKAADESLSLEEREQAAKDAADAADKAEEAAKKADEQVTAAQAVVDAAQAALDKAQNDYEAAVLAASKLLDGSEDDPGLIAKAKQLLEDAEAKVESAKTGLTAAKSTLNVLEAARSTAWTNSETARIAADAAAKAAEGQQDVIDGAKNEHSQGFVDADKDAVDTKADEAISAKELEDAAQDVVDAQTKVDDLTELDKLNSAKEGLAKAKEAYDTAEEARKTAQTAAETAKNNLKDQVNDHSAVVANDWLDNRYADGKAHNYRDVVNAVIRNEHPDWLTDKMVQKVINAAKEHGQLTDGGAYIVRIGNTLETLVGARKDSAAEKEKLDEAVATATTATGVTGSDAQNVLDNLTGKIDAINTDGKYTEELEDLTAAINSANTALNTAKDTYKGKGGTQDVNSLEDAKKALENAEKAYTAAIDALNTAAKTGLDKTATIEALEALKAQKANVEEAKRLLKDLEQKQAAYTEKQDLYNDAKDKAQSANDQYEAAKKAVETAKKNLNDAEIHSAELSEQRLENLKNALERAQLALKNAEDAKNKADEDAAKAKEDADAAESAYLEAVEDANRGIDDIFGGGDPADVEIDDPATPLSAGPVTRAQFVDYLWRHEGEPEAESDLFADHEYAPAIAWALSIDIIDETFQPDELVTGGDVRAILTRFADYAGMTMPELTTLTSGDDEAVLNCDQILAEFFGEEYEIPDLEGLESDDAA